MTTTRTLPAQATISSPSGWTVTVTHLAQDRYPWAEWSDIWQAKITGPDFEHVCNFWTDTPKSPDPDPMAALAYLGDGMLPRELPAAAIDDLAHAIAGMYGQDA